MGNKPSEFYGATCYKCQRSLPPLKEWNDRREEYIDRLVTAENVYVYHGGRYYRPVNEPGHHMCTNCFWEPKRREETRRENERREKERQENERREREKTEQEEQERQARDREEQARIAQEAKRLKKLQQTKTAESQQRAAEAQAERERLEKLRKEKKKQDEERWQRDIQEEKERIDANNSLKNGRNLCDTLKGWIDERTKVRYRQEVVRETFCEEIQIQDNINEQPIHSTTWKTDTARMQEISPQVDYETDITDLELKNIILDELDSNIFVKDMECMFTLLTLLLQRYTELHCSSDIDQALLEDCFSTITQSTPEDEIPGFTAVMTLITLKESQTIEPDEIYDVVRRFLKSLISEGSIKHKNTAWVSRCIYLTVEPLLGDRSAEICTGIIENDIWSFLELEQCINAISFLTSNCNVHMSASIFEQIKMHRISATAFKEIGQSSESWESMRKRISSNVYDEPELSLESVVEEIRSTHAVLEEHLKLCIAITKKTIKELNTVGLCTGLKETLALDYKRLLTADMILDTRNALQINSSAHEIEMLSNSITMMACAVYKSHGYCPRVTQIFTCTLLVVSKRSQVNRLLEIHTGEGKSCIIAMFAAILGFQGLKVDIVSSSPLLARRDVDIWKPFYSIFGLTVSHNTGPQMEPEAEDDKSRRIYRCNVVYGTVSTFASDILRDEFQMKDIRGNRSFQVVIVDEVDLMMLDHGVQLTYLSHRAAGMRHIEPVLAGIWATITQYKMLATDSGENIYCGAPQLFVDAIYGSMNAGEIGIETAMQLLKIAEDEHLLEKGTYESLQASEEDKCKEIMKTITSSDMHEIIRKLQSYIPCDFQLFQLNINNCLIPLESSPDSDYRILIPILLLDCGLACPLYYEKDIKSGISEMINEKIIFSSRTSDKVNDDQLNVPLYLKSFLQQQIPHYVESAMSACGMSENRQYVVNNNEILPIDYTSSGVVEINKKWGQGLQQFLEMKHGLKISALSVITNFMSNIEFFQRYAKQHGSVFGLSGTVGTTSDIKFLNEEYQLKVCKIPTHRRKKTVEDKLILVSGDQEEWMEIICKTLKQKLSPNSENKQKAVLIICEDIQIATAIKLKIEERQVTKCMTMYTRSDSDQVLQIDKQFKAGDVIVATTLAGRGTDISISKDVNDAGGIYIMVTFLPQNRRIELQAFGRTGRKGNPGTVQLVLHAASMPNEYRVSNISRIRKLREEKENNRLEMMLKEDVKEVKMQTILFAQYCVTLKEIHAQIKSRPDKEVILNSLHESWGLWLQMNTRVQTTNESLLANLQEMLSKAKVNVLNGISPIDNFYHLIMYANHLVDSDPATAIRCYSNVIATASRWSMIAYYNRAYCYIMQKDQEHLKNAENDLRKCKELLKNYLCEITLIHQLVSVSLSRTMATSATETTSNFLIQIATRQQIFDYLSKNIEEAIATLEKLRNNGDNAIAEAVGVFSLIKNADYATSMEMNELHLLGMEIVFSVNKEPTFSWGALVVFVLGLCEIIAGSLLMVFTCGALSNIGMGLIAEGVSDIIDGIIGMATGEFSWTAWGIAKAVGIVISIACAGIGKFVKKGLSGIKSSLQSMGQEIKNIPKLTSKGFTVAAKSNLKNIAKLVAKEVTIQTTMRVMTLTEEKILDYIFQKMKATIQNNALVTMKEHFSNGKLSQLANRVLLLDLREYCVKKNVIPSTLRDSTMKLFCNLATYAIEPMMRQQSVQKQVIDNIYKLKDGLTKEFSKSAKLISDLVEGFVSTTVVTKTLIDIQNLSMTFADEVLMAGEKFLNDNQISQLSDEQCENSRLSCVVELKVALANEVARIYGDAIASILEQGISGQIVRGLSRSVNKYVQSVIGDKLSVNKTMELIRAGQNQNFIATMKPSGSYETGQSIVQHYAEVISDPSSPGSILEARIAAQIYKRDVIIFIRSKSGKEEVLTTITSKNHDKVEVIKLLYTPPNDTNQKGHYDVMIKEKVQPINSENNDCLFHAIAQAIKPHADNTTLRMAADKMRTDVANEISSSDGKWSQHVVRRIQLIEFKKIGVEGAGKFTPTLSEEHIKQIELGTVLTYSKNKKRLEEEREKAMLEKKGKDAFKGQIDMDHVPPCSVLTALRNIHAGQRSTLANNILKDVQSNDDEAKRYPNVPTTLVLHEHHAVYLSTGNSKAANRFRELELSAIKENDPVTLLKYHMIGSNPESALKIMGPTFNGGLPDVDKRSTNDMETLKYHKYGFNNIAKNYLLNGRLNVRQYADITKWIDDGKFLDRSDAAYKAVVKHCGPGIKPILRNFVQNEAKREARQ